jgi:hypothetical protein
MLQIMLMVLQSTTTNETRFNNEREMNVNDNLQGWTKDKNW